MLSVPQERNVRFVVSQQLQTLGLRREVNRIEIYGRKLVLSRDPMDASVVDAVCRKFFQDKYDEVVFVDITLVDQ